MALTRRRVKEKQERHDEILDAAEQVFFFKGYQQTSMDEIAQAAQLSRALLYVYFKDKAAIMRSIMLRAAQSIENRFEDALHRGITGIEQIEGIGHAYHAFSVEEPDYFDVLTSINTFPEPDTMDSQLEKLGCCRQRITELMVQALSNGLADGTVDSDHVREPVQTAYYLQGALHGVIMQTRGPKAEDARYPDSSELIEYTIRLLTQSIRTQR